MSHLLLQLFGQFVGEYGRDAEERTEADEHVEEEGVWLPGRPQQERVQGAFPRADERANTQSFKKTEFGDRLGKNLHKIV